MRGVRAAQLLERGFANNTLTWLRPSLGTVDNLAPIDASPPNLRDEMCGGKRKRPASDEDEDTFIANASSIGETALTFFTAGLAPPMAKPSELLAAPPATSEPVVVYTGPKKTGAALIAAVAVDEQKQTVRPRGKKKSQVASKKPDAAAEPKAEAKDTANKDTVNKDTGKKDAGKEAKSEPKAKPTARHASAKPEAAPKAAEKPVAAADKPASAKPAKPKAAAKPAAKPAPKSSEAKPADQKAAASPRS
jgi:D-alanyl-D-alanine carboxypeptidase